MAQLQSPWQQFAALSTGKSPEHILKQSLDNQLTELFKNIKFKVIFSEANLNGTGNFSGQGGTSIGERSSQKSYHKKQDLKEYIHTLFFEMQKKEMGYSERKFIKILNPKKVLEFTMTKLDDQS